MNKQWLVTVAFGIPDNGGVQAVIVEAINIVEAISIACGQNGWWIGNVISVTCINYAVH